MISEPKTIDISLDDLLNQHFAGKVVRKDLTRLVKEGANVPVYVLEYLAKFQTSFYADPADAMFKALGVQ